MRALLLAALPLLAQPTPVPPGWGLNSRLEWAAPSLVPIELADLRPGRLTWLREDLTGPDAWPAHQLLFRRLHAADYRILGLVPYDATTNGHDPQAVPDLRAIYRAAQNLARRADGDVDAWELYNEPDVAFCGYLPDRFTGIARATALGLRSVSAHPILLPSLALPPGPWAERAAANGLLTCGDAANLHYYGHPQDFAALLALTRRFLHDHGTGENLPLWITEIGIKIPGPGSATQRDRQTAYFAATMRTASTARVAAYLPYAFEDAAYSLANPATGAPYPALASYLQSSRTLQLAAPATLDRRTAASPVLLQWAPDRDAALPDKVSACYQFTATAMPGHIRLYNFSPHPVHGTLTFSGLTRIEARLPLVAAVYDRRGRQDAFPSSVGGHRPPLQKTQILNQRSAVEVSDPRRESDPPKSLYPERSRQAQSKDLRTCLPLVPKLNLGAPSAPREVAPRADQHSAATREIILLPMSRLNLPITFPAPRRESDPPKSLYPERSRQAQSKDLRTCLPSPSPPRTARPPDNDPSPSRAMVTDAPLNLPLTLPPNSNLDLPITFTAPTPGYLRETATFLWHDTTGAPDSPLTFGLATQPRPRDFTPIPIALSRPETDPDNFTWIDNPAPYELTSASGPWIALNGLEVSTTATPTTRTAWNARREITETTWNPATPTLFLLDPTRETDAPVMAIARVDGLPNFDFLRLRADRQLETEIYVRLDLLTAAGERYTLFEHGGSNPAHPSHEVWLNRHDFHLYFWSHYPQREHPLDPASIRELQLRLRFAHPSTPVHLTLEALRAK